MNPLEIIVLGEESQEITIAFRKLGHNAFSCDLQDCSGGHPEWHIKDDLRKHLKEKRDLAIFHPVCRIMANSGVRWLHERPERWRELYEAVRFFNLRHEINADHVATENPIIHRYARDEFFFKYGMWPGVGRCDQIFQPWWFGHKKMKATCLWLKNLPKLKPTNIVGPPPKDKEERKKWQDCWQCPPGPEREKIRSKTYRGVAEAMATQWSEYIIEQKSKIGG